MNIILLMSAFVVCGVAADSPVVQIYSLGSQLWRSGPVAGSFPPSSFSDDPQGIHGVDSYEADFLFACRSWSEAQEAMKRIAIRRDKNAKIAIVQTGIPDADLNAMGLDVIARDIVRRDIGHVNRALIPGLDGSRMLAIQASPDAMTAINAAFKWAFDRGHRALIADLGAEGMAVAESLRATIHLLRDDNGNIASRLNRMATSCPSAIYLPEEMVPGRAIAVAPHGQGAFIADYDLVYWWPDHLPLLAARILRKRLDSGTTGRIYMHLSLPNAQAPPFWVAEGEWEHAIATARMRDVSSCPIEGIQRTPEF